MIIFLQISGGLTLLFFGGEFLVRGAVAIARHLGVSTLIIGLTIVAVGTSAPEIVVSIGSALKGYPDIAVGNIVGSNIANILLVMGLSALVYPVAISSRIVKNDNPTLLFITCIFILFCWTNFRIDLWEGIFLIIFLIIYISQMIYSSRKNGSKSKQLKHEIEEIEEELPEDVSNPKAIFFTIAGIAALIIGADILVEGAVSLAHIFGLSEAVIGLTLIAVGSSAPEIATCVVAAYRKHTDLVAGNVLGSNLLNILLGLNAAALIKPLEVNERFFIADLWFMLAATIMLFLIILIRKNISRLTGGLFFSLYIAYIVYQFMNNS